MKFRTRLLILVLTTTLIPLALSFLSQRSSILHFGNKLAENTRTLLNDNAVTLLHTLIDGYGRILERDKTMALLTLQIQAQAVEQRFTSTLPQHPPKIYYSTDFTSPELQPADMSTSTKHQKVNADGEKSSIPVSYSEQVIFLTSGTRPADVTEDLVRMSSMPEVYKALHDIQPELFLWQYTALESGLHSSYPGKGGYPDSYDPRQRQWYREAVAKGDTIQQLLTDLSTGTLILTLAKPVYRGSGELLGVTALDIDYLQFFDGWKIPPQWADFTESMVLIFNEQDQLPEHHLEILLRNRREMKSSDWQLPVEHEYIDLTVPELSEIQSDILQGRSGVKKVSFRGKDELWAYGSRELDAPFPLVIVPYKQVLAQAVTAENFVNQQISLGLKISAALTVFVVVAVIIVTIIRSRRVTDPILDLAGAARQLSEGNFDARVEIRFKDEMANLGRIFNTLGPRLKERESMLQSLALAKEIQQQLLPDHAPVFATFELAGRSLYCDDTGGDYYDFIEMQQDGQPLLGLAVGDVSGHGIGAALVMAAARSILRSLAEQHPRELKTLLENINRHLSRDTGDAYFMTLFYGVLFVEERKLHWISAGQAPMFHFRRGEVEELSSSGIPLGIIETAAYDNTAVMDFAPGDILLIGTDGIWEAVNSEGEMFGTERLVELLKNHAHETAENILDRIVTAVNEFRRERPQDDDVTLMIIKSK